MWQRSGFCWWGETFYQLNTGWRHPGAVVVCHAGQSPQERVWESIPALRLEIRAAIFEPNIRMNRGAWRAKILAPS